MVSAGCSEDDSEARGGACPTHLMGRWSGAAAWVIMLSCVRRPYRTHRLNALQVGRDHRGKERDAVESLCKPQGSEGFLYH